MSVLTPFNFGFEYKLATEVVVFSHGFGVGRDNRGLFTDITECLPSGLGYVLFDYYDYNDALATVVLTDFTEQTKRLRQVIDWAQKQPGVVKVHLVAHSIGCIVAALARPVIDGRVAFLASPASIGKKTKEYFTSKPGATEKNGIWTIPRQDGTYSLVPSSLFDEFESTNAADVLINFAGVKPYVLYIAGRDEILPLKEYEVLRRHSAITVVTIPGADHNFNGDSRKEVISAIGASLRRGQS